MIDLGSIAGMHSHNHQLHAYCPRCDRWALLPLAEMIYAGQGSRTTALSHRGRRDAIFDRVNEIVDEAKRMPDQERQRQRRIALAMLREVRPH